MKLWVDDERPAPDDYWTWAKTSTEALALLRAVRKVGFAPRMLSLDHDLGGDDTTRPVMLWMCEHDWWPAELRIHTANPVGREWLDGMADRYGPDWMKRGTW